MISFFWEGLRLSSFYWVWWSSHPKNGSLVRALSAFAPYMSGSCNLSCVVFGRVYLSCGSWLLRQVMGSLAAFDRLFRVVLFIFSVLFLGGKLVVWVSFYCFLFSCSLWSTSDAWVWHVFCHLRCFVLSLIFILMFYLGSNPLMYIFLFIYNIHFAIKKKHIFLLYFCV